MMLRRKKRTPSAEERLRATDPSLKDAELSCVLVTDLDRDEPNKKQESFLYCVSDRFGICRNGETVCSNSLEDISEFRLQRGVGCVSVEYALRGSEEAILLCRGSFSCRDSAAAFVKQMNKQLRRLQSGEAETPKKQPPAAPKVGKKRALLRLLKMSKPEWKYLAVSVLLFIITTVIGLVVPYFNRVLVDDYIQGEVSSGFWIGFGTIIASIFVFSMAQRLISMARGYFLSVAGNHLIVRLRSTVFQKIQELSISKISRQTSGELMKRVNGDTAHIKQFLINQMPSLLEQGLLLVSVIILLLTVDWRLALLVFLPAPLIMLAFRMFWRWMRRLSRRIRGLNARENAILHDIFSGIRVVKAYGMEQREEERYVKAAQDEKKAQLQQERIWAILMPFLSFLMGMGEYVLLFFLGTQILKPDSGMSIGQITQLSAYAGMIYSPLETLLRAPRMFVHMLTSLSAIFELLDEPADMVNVTNAPDAKGFEGRIELDRVSFGYESSDEVLKNISLEILPGEFIGLVGRSGVGKSTMINLIMRMHDVDDGAIRIDGKDIREIPQELLRSQMGVVLQENFLFAGTVWQNLAYAKPDATREEIIMAAKAAGAHEFIIHLPNGYQTVIGERGHTLSGGERQRVAIARALLHDPKILILDEATSALDTETEKQIQDALAELSKGRTTIAIAHRLSTLRNATRLVVLDKGGVAEVGTHDELMEKQGIYYGLVMAQREMSQMSDASGEPNTVA